MSPLPEAVTTLAASCTGECQKSGPIGLGVILVLCIACYFLFKSMSRHLRKVRDEFPDGRTGAEAEPAKPPPPAPADDAWPVEPLPPSAEAEPPPKAP